MTPTWSTSSAGRRRGVTSIGMGLLVAMVLIVLAATVAALTTTSMHLAFTEEARQQALEVAYSGMAQFLANVEAGMVDTTTYTAGRNLMDNYTPPPPSQDPFLKAITSGGAGGLVPIPIPYNHLPVPQPGQPPPACYITFNSTQNQVPWSTSNLSFPTPTPAWPGNNTRMVPGFSVDVIATGVYQGVQKSVACKVTRRWTYAVCSAGPIFITGDTAFPSQIDGDVYSLAQGNTPDIGIGRDASGTATNGTRIRGEAVSVDAATAGIQVVGGNQVNGVRNGAHALQYPNLTPVSPAGFTDLASAFSSSAGNGAYVQYDSSNGWYDLEAVDPSTGGPPQHSQPLYVTNGNYVLNGTLTIRGGSWCSGIVLQRATLVINGDLRLQARPTDLYGVEAALCVNGNMSIHYGFMDGGDKGFVVNANSIETQAGGQFKGLIIVGGTISMQSQPYYPPTSGFLEPGGLSEYAGGGGGGGGPPPPPPQP
ncbi:MAG: hypothetical protein ACYCW6_14660, partial [Candidatus Xenobia bacterium]